MDLKKDLMPRVERQAGLSSFSLLGGIRSTIVLVPVSTYMPTSFFDYDRNGGVAQMVERAFRIREVTGSMPVSSNPTKGARAPELMLKNKRGMLGPPTLMLKIRRKTRGLGPLTLC